MLFVECLLTFAELLGQLRSSRIARLCKNAIECATANFVAEGDNTAIDPGESICKAAQQKFGGIMFWLMRGGVTHVLQDGVPTSKAWDDLVCYVGKLARRDGALANNPKEERIIKATGIAKIAGCCSYCRRDLRKELSMMLNEELKGYSGVCLRCFKRDGKLYNIASKELRRHVVLQHHCQHVSAPE